MAVLLQYGPHPACARVGVSMHVYRRMSPLTYMLIYVTYEYIISGCNDTNLLHQCVGYI